jgi:hypothetical protein
MPTAKRTDAVRETKETYAARLEAFRNAATPRNSGSPQAVEATLASISEEVTAEAIERQQHELRLQAVTAAKATSS